MCVCVCVYYTNTHAHTSPTYIKFIIYVYYAMFIYAPGINI